MTRMPRPGAIAAFMLVITVVAGCTGESALPEPTGKGTVRAINAAESSPSIRFLIEERLLQTMAYKTESPARRWDDFEYNFNFEFVPPGGGAALRIATEVIKVDVNRDYTLVFTGSVDAPSILVWEAETRSFSESETVFEARFAHLAPTLGEIDFYFEPPGTVPVLGMARGTLGNGEILPPIDVEAGDYVLTVTTAGDPADIVYQSGTISYAERSAFVIPLFDGDELDVAPYTARSFSAAGGAIVMQDDRFPPTVRLFQASSDLPVADVYTDEALTELLVANHAFGDITGDLPVEAGDTVLRYTPAGDTGAILQDGALQAVVGTRTNFIVLGTGTTRRTVFYSPDRRTISTAARLSPVHVAANHDFLDFYAVAAGTDIQDVNRTTVLSFGVPSALIPFDAGSYDLYATVLDEKTVVAGPVSLDVALGDTVEIVVFDVTDPNAAEIRVVPAP